MPKASTIALGAVIFVGFFDSFAQFPIVAPYARSLGAMPSVVGVAVAAYSVTNLAGNLLAGYLIDWLGRKRLLIVGLGMSALAVLLYGAVHIPIQLIAVRAFHGLSAAVLAPASFALLGDLFPSERRSGVMGAGGTLIALAAILAPAASGILRDRWGFGAVFALVGTLLLLAVLLAQALVPESHRARPDERPSIRIFKTLFVRRSLILAYLSAVTLTFGLGILVTHLPVHLSDLGYGASQTGLAFSAFAIASLAVMVGGTRRVSRAGGRLTPTGWGLVVTSAALLLLPVRFEMLAIACAMALYGIGFGLVFPAATAQIADATDQHERGTAFGIFYAFYSVGVVPGALVSGLLAGWGTLSPFHLGAIFAATAGLVMLRTRAKPAAPTTSA